MFQKIKQFGLKNYGKIIVAILIVILIILMITGGKKKKADAIEYYTVTERDITEQVVIAGRVQTQQRAGLSFNRGGRVNDLLVSEGQVVEKGQVLARIAMGQQYADLKSAQASLAIAQSDVQDATLDLDQVRAQQETLVRNAYRALLNNDLQVYNRDAGDNAVPPTITGTYTGTQEGEYILDIYGSAAESGFSFSLSGLESGTYSGYTSLPGQLGNQGLYIQFDPRSNYRSQEWFVPIPNTRSTSYTAARNTYTSVVAAAERAIQMAENAIGSSTSTDQLTRAQAQVAQAQARINGIYSQIADGTIRAPFSGVVGSLNIEEGENASFGQSVITLIGEGQYEMVLNVPEIDIAKVVIGDLVNITLDAYTNTIWEGEVVSINASETFIEGVPVYETTVVFTNPDERIRSGMNGQAIIITGVATEVPSIPFRALERVGRETYEVRVQDEEGNTQKKKVLLGLRGNDSFVEILEGLEIGDIIVLDKELEA